MTPENEAQYEEFKKLLKKHDCPWEASRDLRAFIRKWIEDLEREAAAKPENPSTDSPSG